MTDRDFDAHGLVIEVSVPILTSMQPPGLMKMRLMHHQEHQQGHQAHQSNSGGTVDGRALKYKVSIIKKSSYLFSYGVLAIQGCCSRCAQAHVRNPSCACISRSPIDLPSIVCSPDKAIS